MDVKETEILGDDIDRHWYYASKAKAMRAMLGTQVVSSILDVGAGSGYFSGKLLETTEAREAWCVDIGYPNDSDAFRAGKPVHYRRSIASSNADLVLLMDVLEHVDDDVALLAEYVRKVPAGARFLITVPAFQFLWSAHDDFLEHRRRYVLPQLEHVVREAGLHVDRGGYFFGGVFPIAAGMRLSQRYRAGEAPAQSQLKRHHWLVNRVLASICDAELPFMRWNRIAGLSIFCMATKKP
ncbi:MULTISPECIES: bifunctional 2-polyprenyl-6-hydroxyphenol methylase/3-demethylubiquinol 3-O-methyltransferase UbiG [unclassified Caballeronia]|uniref:class I SAM-dependent methyltransferase n=1 Tax=unclassified Caballeronia TaxID=2646786 RepID=UPI00158B7C06|nr:MULTISPECIES: methyltransferase domain-containing protein [unclassified Caballeronia]QSN60683.1 methyltransferase domain-containing protein [Caballeronia sp. M1242]